MAPPPVHHEPPPRALRLALLALGAVMIAAGLVVLVFLWNRVYDRFNAWSLFSGPPLVALGIAVATAAKAPVAVLPKRLLGHAVTGLGACGGLWSLGATLTLFFAPIGIPCLIASLFVVRLGRRITRRTWPLSA